MGSHFCLSVRFLNDTFHGRRDGDQLEWPPSPLRVFQTIVATAARKNRGEPSSEARTALQWLEAEAGIPHIIAPWGTAGTGYSLSVPNNAMDLVAKAWSRGNDTNKGDANPATHRTMKSVRPTWADEGAIHYLWRLPDPTTDEVLRHVKVISETAAAIVALGWGADLAVGEGRLLTEDEMTQLSGEQWLPAEDSSENGLRMPMAGTLNNLVRRHDRFRTRLGPTGYRPPPPLSVFKKIDYRSATKPTPRPVVAFSLLKPDASGFRPFDSAGRGLTLVGMMRNALKKAAQQSGWPESRIGSVILGHGEANGDPYQSVGPRRFAYLPLPSLESRGVTTVGSVRRMMISLFAADESDLNWLRRTVSGHELRDERTQSPLALLSLIPDSNNIVKLYRNASATWATVTPVVLPGYDDPRHYRRRLERGVDAETQHDLQERLTVRIDRLLRRAIVQAGFSDVLASWAEIDWCKAGFWPGTDLADRYGVADHLKRFPRYHVKIIWRNAKGSPIKVEGPICIGGGRFYGLGLLAPM